MNPNTLERSLAGIRAAWSPLDSDLIAACCQHLGDLLQAPVTEPWLAALHAQAPARHELHRDAQQGHVLLAHTEAAGLYRPPHDHGRGWVIYGVQRGEVEMGSYGRVVTPGGGARLVKRGATRVQPGQLQVYLPGDIHDTHCLSASALLFRFTERDLQRDDTLNRYTLRDGAWVLGAA